MKKTAIAGILLIFYTGCNSSKPKEDNSETVITQSDEVSIVSENGFTDVTLRISGKDEGDSSTVYHISGVYQGTEVGFNASIPHNAGQSGFGHGLILSSMGEKSDAFLKMLCQLYRIPYTKDSKFCTADTVSYVDLNKMAADMGGKNLSGNSLKLFFEAEGETEDSYRSAEVYLNIDTTNNTVEFDEKDPEYRTDLIFFLTEKQ
jgi:hypothetical protein